MNGEIHFMWALNQSPFCLQSQLWKSSSSRSWQLGGSNKHVYMVQRCPGFKDLYIYLNLYIYIYPYICWIFVYIKNISCSTNVCWLASATGEIEDHWMCFLSSKICGVHIKISSLSPVWTECFETDLCWFIHISKETFLFWGTPFTDSSSETVAHADVSFAEHLLSTLGRGAACMQSAVSILVEQWRALCINHMCSTHVFLKRFLWLKLKVWDLERLRHVDGFKKSLYRTDIPLSYTTAILVRSPWTIHSHEPILLWG